MGTADIFAQKFDVTFDYPVCFTRGAFRTDNPLVAETIDRLGEGRRHRVLVYVDEGVAAAHPRLTSQVKEYFHALPARLELVGLPIVLPGGEPVKSRLDLVREILWTVGNEHLCRHSFIMAIGGGSFLDMVGFAASLAHRGLRLVRLPTTTLAQDDAGIGIKTGMNEHGMKNFLGTFSPPFAVINDVEFLPTLDDTHWLGGVAEAFKVAIIKDRDFFNFLCSAARDLRARNLAAMEKVVRRCAALHLEHIRTSGDPFEMGAARPLDFGHWAAHRLEALSTYRIAHGQAAAIGIALDSFCAMRRSLLPEEEFERIVTGLLACGLPIWCEELQWRRANGTLEVLEGLNQFREHLGGTLTLSYPNGMGRICDVHHVNPDDIEEAVRVLHDRARSGTTGGQRSSERA